MTHHHGAEHHPHEFDPHEFDRRGAELTAEAEVGLGWARPAFDWLAALVADRRGRVDKVLDVGSGPGVYSLALAEAFPQAEVTALDRSPQLLDLALARAAGTPQQGRIRAHTGDLTELGSGTTEFGGTDLIWISRVLHHVSDPVRVLAGIGRSLSQTGLLAVAEAALPRRYFPRECGVGDPGLLDRLDAAVGQVIDARLRSEQEWAAGQPTPRPGVDIPQQFAQAGLTPVATKTFLLDLPAPVSGQVRQSVVGRLGDEVEWGTGLLSAEDRKAWKVLLDPADARSLHRREDLYLLTATSVFVAAR